MLTEILNGVLLTNNFHHLYDYVETGSIRLSHGYYGYVEVYDGDWKLVCDYSINSLEADVICRSAGFRRAESFSYIYLYYYYYYYLPDLNTINNVNCFGNETSLLGCSYTEYSYCYDENIVTCEEGIQFIYICKLTNKFGRFEKCSMYVLVQC